MHNSELNTLLERLEEDKKQRLAQIAEMKGRAGTAHEYLALAMVSPPGSTNRKRLLEDADRILDQVITEFKEFRDSLQ